MEKAQELLRVLRAATDDVVFGMDEIVHALAIALVVRGHVLLQGVPGIGKTLLAKTIAGALGGTFKRIQGTADLMPSDITGVYVYDRESYRWEFRNGPLFADVVLVDEVNRASPKTQSALLEAMEERQVSVDRTTFRLPENFLVIATQNPRELEGTYPLPESQLDRFVMQLDIAYAAQEAEFAVVRRYGTADGGAAPARSTAMASPALLAEARSEAAAVRVSDELVRYVLALARSTRESERLSLGLSTRGILALVRCAQVAAAMAGVEYVAPDDIKRMAPFVITHRLMLTPEAYLDAQDAGAVVREMLASVDVPR